MRLRLTLDIERSRRDEPGVPQLEHRDTDTLVETPYPVTGFAITPGAHLLPEERR